MILGANGAGKSTIFDVVALLRDFCVYGQLPGATGPIENQPDTQGISRFLGRSRTRWQEVPEQTFELDVAGNQGAYHFRLVVDSWGAKDQLRVVKEEVQYAGRPIFSFDKGQVHLFNDQHIDKVQYPFDWTRSALATISERHDNARLSWFKKWLGAFLCIAPDPRRMSGLAPDEARRPDQYHSNFADWYRRLRQETQDQDYLDNLREVIDGFETMRLEEAGEGRREIKIRTAESITVVIIAVVRHSSIWAAAGRIL